MRAFLDTDILVDLFNNEERAINLINRLGKQNAELVFSEYSLTVLPVNDVKNIVLNADSFVIANYKIAVFTAACDFCKERGGNFRDWLQYFCAESESCDIIYTSKRDFPMVNISTKGYEN